MYRVSGILIHVLLVWIIDGSIPVASAPTSQLPRHIALDDTAVSTGNSTAIIGEPVSQVTSNIVPHEASKATTETNSGSQGPSLITSQATQATSPPGGATSSPGGATSQQTGHPTVSGGIPVKTLSFSTSKWTLVTQTSDGTHSTTTSTKTSFPWKEVSYGLSSLCGVLLIVCVGVSVLACKMRGKLKKVHNTLYPITTDSDHLYQDLHPKQQRAVKVELKAIAKVDVEEVDSPTFAPSSPPTPFSRTVNTSSAQKESSLQAGSPGSTAPEPPTVPPPRLPRTNNNTKQQKSNSQSTAAAYVNEAFSSDVRKRERKSTKRKSKKSNEFDTGLYDDMDDDIYEEYEHSDGYGIDMIDAVLADGSHVENAERSGSDAAVDKEESALRESFMQEDSVTPLTHPDDPGIPTSLSGLPQLTIQRNNSAEQLKETVENTNRIDVIDSALINECAGGVDSKPEAAFVDDLSNYDDATVLAATPEAILEDLDDVEYDTPIYIDKRKDNAQTTINPPGDNQPLVDELLVYDDADVQIGENASELPLYEDYEPEKESFREMKSADGTDALISNLRNGKMPSCGEEENEGTSKVDTHLADEGNNNTTDIHEWVAELKTGDRIDENVPSDVNTNAGLLDLMHSSEHPEFEIYENETVRQLGKHNGDINFNQATETPLILPKVPPRRDLLLQSPSGNGLEPDTINSAVSATSNISSSPKLEPLPHNGMAMHLDQEELQLRPGSRFSELETAPQSGQYFLDMDDIPSEIREIAQN